MPGGLEHAKLRAIPTSKYWSPIWEVYRSQGSPFRSFPRGLDTLPAAKVERFILFSPNDSWGCIILTLIVKWVRCRSSLCREGMKEEDLVFEN